MMLLQFIGLFDFFHLLQLIQGGQMQWVVGPSFKFWLEKDTQNRNDRNDQAATSEDHAI